LDEILAFDMVARRVSFNNLHLRNKNHQSAISGGRTILSTTFPREGTMPVYDYVCLDCHKPFEIVLTLNEHDQKTPQCPHCDSKNVEQEAAAFFAVTSKKS
jgi:putative FmdB family regulatory protein